MPSAIMSMYCITNARRHRRLRVGAFKIRPLDWTYYSTVPIESNGRLFSLLSPWCRYAVVVTQPRQLSKPSYSSQSRSHGTLVCGSCLCTVPVCVPRFVIACPAAVVSRRARRPPLHTPPTPPDAYHHSRLSRTAPAHFPALIRSAVPALTDTVRVPVQPQRSSVPRASPSVCRQIFTRSIRSVDRRRFRQLVINSIRLDTVPQATTMHKGMFKICVVAWCVVSSRWTRRDDDGRYRRFSRPTCTYFSDSWLWSASWSAVCARTSVGLSYFSYVTIPNGDKLKIGLGPSF